MSDLFYLLSIFGVLAAYGVAGWVLWQGVELAYWIYCKATGREY